MIILPTRRRLERRRDALYRHLHSLMPDIPVHTMEDIMRQVHGINLKLKNYFIRDGQHEAAEIFEEKDPLEVKYPTETENPVTLSIEDVQGEIEI